MRRGLFIVFEGLDGAGLTTQVETLTEYLKSRDRKVITTREPTNNLIGGMIRGSLTGEWYSNSACLQLLFAADRANHLEKKILPSLAEGIDVISDRYFLSTLAYGGVDLNDNWLKKINEKFPVPDITFIIKVSSTTSIKRIKESKYTLELFDKEKELEKVKQNYDKLAQEYKNVFIINGEASEGEAFNQIKRILDKFLEQREVITT